MEITPLGAENLGWKFFLIWMCFNASFVPIIYFFYPETAGKTLEELDTLFYDTTKAWKLNQKGSQMAIDLDARLGGTSADGEDGKLEKVCMHKE